MSTEQTEQRLIDFVLGHLSAEEATALEAELAASDALIDELARVTDALASVGLELEPVAPADAVRARIVDSIVGESRFARFTKRVGELLEVAYDTAVDMVAAIDDASVWEPQMVPGIGLYHLEGGAQLANAIVGFIRIKPGVTFPHHRHKGEEIALVVQGSYRDSSGAIFRTGDEIHNAGGTEHDITALDGPELIYLAIVFEGMRIGVIDFEPGDPRV